MPTITIGSTVIDFPNSSSSPNWSPAIIEFAQAVAANLAFAVGPYDIPPQSQAITQEFEGPTDITNLVFSTSAVRAAFIRYSVYRESSTPAVATETGTISIVYNQTNPSLNKWELSQDKTGDASITFSITDTGQVQFTTTTIGPFVTGKIYFTAQSMLQ